MQDLAHCVHWQSLSWAEMATMVAMAVMAAMAAPNELLAPRCALVRA